jgi:ketosteroid isomerase-like protein
MPNFSEGIHTTINPKGTGWVALSGDVVITSHRTKAAAIDSGRRLAKRYGEQFTIHRKDGAVIETRTYAKAPLAA